MTIEEKEIILKVLNTLNDIEVIKGYENWSKMVGSMGVLQNLINLKEGEIDDSKSTK